MKPTLFILVVGMPSHYDILKQIKSNNGGLPLSLWNGLT
jgi:hypothetical protein